jgi:hypothetical protein
MNLNMPSSIINDVRMLRFKGAKRALVRGGISSCFFHLRKADTDSFKLGLDLAQTPAR